MSVVRYQALYRPIYEWWSFAVWLIAAGLLFASAVVSPFPKQPFVYLAAVAIAMGVARFIPALRMTRRRRRLNGFGLEFQNIEALKAQVAKRPDAICLGKGFDWGREHTQALVEVIRCDPNKLAPRSDDSQMGDRWLHGLSATKTDVYLPLVHSESHTLIVATTGWGKTRLLDTLIAQDVLRGQTVIVIDPKFDRALCDAIRDSCKSCGRDRDFIFFHPGFPAESVRLDTMCNFSSPTELASRVTSITPAKPGDPFVAIGHSVLDTIVGGLMLTSKKPSLLTLRRYIEGSPEILVVRAMKSYFGKLDPNWESKAKKYISQTKDDSEAALCDALVKYYRDCVQDKHPNTAIDALINLKEHNRDHMQKVLSSTMPVLRMLTNGELGKLLSPDADDPSDQRMTTDFARVINQKKVIYIALDSLSNQIVGSAIGALVLADLQGVAGMRYNYGDGNAISSGETAAAVNKLDLVNIYVDEAAQVANDPLIAMLAMARGAKFSFKIATQTFADWSARYGSMDKALMILGNVNNIIAGRVRDGHTQKYITEHMGKTLVQNVQRSRSDSANTDAPTHFSSSHSETVVDREVDKIPPDVLGTLPNMEYFASISGGRLVKGRVAILDKKAA